MHACMEIYYLCKAGPTFLSSVQMSGALGNLCRIKETCRRENPFRLICLPPLCSPSERRHQASPSSTFSECSQMMFAINQLNFYFHVPCLWPDPPWFMTWRTTPENDLKALKESFPKIVQVVLKNKDSFPSILELAKNRLVEFLPGLLMYGTEIHT